MWRRPGDVGLICERALDLRSLEDLDRLAGAKLHDGLLPAGRVPRNAPRRFALLNLNHVDALHVDLEELLDGLADLRLVRRPDAPERVAPARRAGVRLLPTSRGRG